MSHSELNRRTFLAGAAGAAVASLAGHALAQGSKTGIDAATWTPQYISSIAGTAEYDTAAECARVTPLSHDNAAYLVTGCDFVVYLQQNVEGGPVSAAVRPAKH